jgi:hypothetical protein
MAPGTNYIVLTETLRFKKLMGLMFCFCVLFIFLMNRFFIKARVTVNNGCITGSAGRTTALQLMV